MSDAVRCPATISTTATLLNLRKKYKKRVTQFQDFQNNYFFQAKPLTLSRIVEFFQRSFLTRDSSGEKNTHKIIYDLPFSVM